MAVEKLCHVWLLLSLVVVESVVMTGQALYCRDPDTGKLYAENSTWASTTFCGNYTCKLKKRNVTETQYTPIRRLNITNIHTEGTLDDKKDNVNKTVLIKARIEPITHKDRTLESYLTNAEEKILNEGNNIKEDTVTQKVNSVSDAALTEDDGNRYLTENEIKSITDILHTVKKSDLDAIVDIYNLAQDIYNEMDKVTNEAIDDNSVKSSSDEKNRHFTKKYWYDPLAYKERVDVVYQDAQHVPTTIQPTNVINKNKLNMDPSYTGPFANQDFRKLPYYYPISNFQRSSSYHHTVTMTTPLPKVDKPCKAKQLAAVQVEDQNLIRPSYLLPYPFAYVHYNSSHYPNSMFYNVPNTWDYYNRQRSYQPYYQAFMAPIPTASDGALENSLNEAAPVVEQKAVKDKNLLTKILVKNKDSKPDWKTEQLTNQMLDEVRAKIDTSKILKAFPFRKKIKLEKAGRMIKLEDITRSKRSIDLREEMEAVLEEQHETFIEKTTCLTKVIPGYFRYGNLSRPYPECCPQLINHNR